MKTITVLNNKKLLQLISSVMLLSALLFLVACSSTYERGGALVAGDEIKAGPGIFSGSKGGFYLVGGEEKAASSKPTSKMNLDETSKVLDEKIEQLKRDQQELELLKREINKKLKS